MKMLLRPSASVEMSSSIVEVGKVDEEEYKMTT
jgi:hypothetical protein